MSHHLEDVAYSQFISQELQRKLREKLHRVTRDVNKKSQNFLKCEVQFIKTPKQLICITIDISHVSLPYLL